VNGGPIQRVVTHGTFELDGGSWEVDNNIWVVGDDSEVVVFDAAHDAGPIVMAVGGRHVVAVVCTHGHNDHVTVAPELGEALDAPVLLHAGDDMLWRMTHPDKDFRTVNDGDTLRVAGHELRAIHTPGHSPGSVCWHAPELGAVFSGDTLFPGGPGNTSREPASAAAYGMPQAFAWNMGTMGIAASEARRPIASGLSTPRECSTVERCEYSTPFGLPVVPDV